MLNNEKEVIEYLRRSIGRKEEQIEEYYSEIVKLESKIDKIRDILDHDADYDDCDFESRKFQDDIRRVIDEKI